MNNGPLSGIRVLDLTRVLAGPLCTMMLGDLGADVIKIERPVRGDDTRGWGPPFDDHGQSAYYLAINRNKLGVALDFRSAADRDFLQTLLRDADVVIDNFIPGTLERLGIDLSAAVEKHARLVWCTITGFGAESRRPGYDFVVQAEAGWMSITGAAHGAPMKSGLALADIIAGKDAAIATLAALVGRDHRSPADRRIVISLADSARAALINVAQNALLTNHDATRWGNAHANLVPYQLFDARDRPIVIAVGSDEQWVECARVLGMDDLARDPGLATNAGRLAQRQRVIERFTAAVVSRPAAEWIRALSEVGVPCGVVKTVLEAIRETAASPLTGMPSPVAGDVRHAPPKLDEHGSVVRRLGWEAFREVSGGR